MEHGFYHESVGYWQTSGALPQDVLNDAPDGTVEVPLKIHGAAEWDGDRWVIPIETIRTDAITSMRQRINALTAQFTAGVPAAELASWPTKASEAEKVLAGGKSAMIDAEAQALGQTSQEVATVIASKSAQYTVIIGSVTGLRRKAEAAIEAATDAAGVDEALQSALIEAEAMAADMVAYWR